VHQARHLHQNQPKLGASYLLLLAAHKILCLY
jgi:hypothetical protein